MDLFCFLRDNDQEPLPRLNPKSKGEKLMLAWLKPDSSAFVKWFANAADVIYQFRVLDVLV